MNDCNVCKRGPSTLGEMKVGERAQVSGYTKGVKGYRHKLLAMGLTPGTHFRVTRVAPMGDPVEIELRGFSLSLRKDEASALQVKQS